LHEIVEGAPNLVDNHLYVGTASYCDTGPYYGRIIDINPDTAAIAHTWYVNGGTSTQGAQGGSVWGWGGVSVDPADGDVYAATGNAITPPENQPFSDSVVRLSANLVLKQFNTPGVSVADDDFGTTPVLFQKPDCPKQLVVEQKNGSVYLYDRDTISLGHRQRIQFSQPNLIGVAAWSSQTQMLYVVNNKGTTDMTYVPGIAAFTLDEDCNLQLAWQTQASVSIGSTPHVANGVVYYTGGFRGVVRALDAMTGTELWNSGTSVSGPFLAAPVVNNGVLYAAGYDHKLHAWGLGSNN
jgi:outer membrane protein assembly factor BamB